MAKKRKARNSQPLPKRASFLKRNKNVNEKFTDILQSKGVKKTAKLFKVSPSTVSRWKKTGYIIENEKRKKIITKTFKKIKVSKIVKGKKKIVRPLATVNVTKEFTPHNFGRNTWFLKPKKGKEFLRPPVNGYYVFRAGVGVLYSVTHPVPKGSKKKWLKLGYKNNEYHVENTPISFHYTNYDFGFENFFNEVKRFIESKKSMVKFWVNYFDVIKHEEK